MAYQAAHEVLDHLWHCICCIVGFMHFWHRRVCIVSVPMSNFPTQGIWLRVECFTRALQVGQVSNNTNLLPWADTWLAAATACDVSITYVHRLMLSTAPLQLILSMYSPF